MIIPIFICKRYLLKMKKLTLLIILLNCFITSNLFAQSPKAIEADLLRSFKKIDGNNPDNTTANKVFAEKLKAYAEKQPATLEQNFALLKAEHLDVSSSDDGLFRIYSWDTWTGGTMHFFENIFQYKSGAKTMAVLDTPTTEGDSRPNYYQVYTFKANNKTYYLAKSVAVLSSASTVQFIQVFAIENEKLNTGTKLIKTPSGLHSQLSVECDLSAGVNHDINKIPNLSYNTKTQAIRIPLITAKGKITDKFITYKFTGQYFEKAKS